jgi:hypothetical protein
MLPWPCVLWSLVREREPGGLVEVAVAVMANLVQVDVCPRGVEPVLVEADAPPMTNSDAISMRKIVMELAGS